MVEKGRGPAFGEIDELVEHNEFARTDVGPQAADAGDGNDAFHARLFQRHDVSAVVDPVRRAGVAFAVPGQEGELQAVLVLVDEQRDVAVLRRDRALFDQRAAGDGIEAAASDDGDAWHNMLEWVQLENKVIPHYASAA